jgi:hypothetical protein
VLSGPVPIALRIASIFAGTSRAKTLRRLAACSGIAGSLCMRYGWVEAGAVSARDWKLPLEIDQQPPPNFTRSYPKSRRAAQHL